MNIAKNDAKWAPQINQKLLSSKTRNKIQSCFDCIFRLPHRGGRHCFPKLLLFFFVVFWVFFTELIRIKRLSFLFFLFFFFMTHYSAVFTLPPDPLPVHLCCINILCKGGIKYSEWCSSSTQCNTIDFGQWWGQPLGLSLFHTHMHQPETQTFFLWEDRLSWGRGNVSSSRQDVCNERRERYV